MVQLMGSDTDNHSPKKVKLEVKDEIPHFHILKRPKSESPHKSVPNDDFFPTPPDLYSPLDERKPLGLRLRKSPSLLDLIQMRLSQKDDDQRISLENKKDHKGGGVKDCGITTTDSKLKASNFLPTILKIGTWEYKSRYEGDLVARCYYARRKLVWEVLDGRLKNKIEIPWSDIMALKAKYPEDGPGTLEIVLARRPNFFRELNPLPRRHTLWQATSDFTGGQASMHRRHFLQCPEGSLGKHFEKLIHCDPRLNLLSQQSDLVLYSPYFEPGSAIDDQMESDGGFDSNGEEQAGPFGLQDVESGSAVQSSSSKSEHNLVSRAVENVPQENTAPSSVMNTHAIKDSRGIGAETLKFLSDLDQIKLPGLHPSMSMNDLVNHIGHCISEQMGPGNCIFPGNSQHNRSILEEFTQYLFSDSQLTTASDEQNVMSRVNSLYCLLQKDPSTAEDTMITILPSNGLDADEAGKVGESNSTQQDDASGCKQGTVISRMESVGELLNNLPSIASLPQFLFHMSEDSVNQVRK